MLFFPIHVAYVGFLQRLGMGLNYWLWLVTTWGAFYAHNCVSCIVNTGPWSWINEDIHQEILGTLLGYGSSHTPGSMPLDVWTLGPRTCLPGPQTSRHKCRFLPFPTIFDVGKCWLAWQHNMTSMYFWFHGVQGGYGSNYMAPAAKPCIALFSIAVPNYPPLSGPIFAGDQA